MAGAEMKGKRVESGRVSSLAGRAGDTHGGWEGGREEKGRGRGRDNTDVCIGVGGRRPERERCPEHEVEPSGSSARRMLER
eukprot:766174-Hanusia_phi.AAC.2